MKHLEFQPDRLHTDQLQPDQLQSGKLWLSKWIKVSKERFNEILSTVTEAKNNKLKASVDKNIITVNSVEELVKDIASKKLNLKETKSKFNTGLDNDISKIAGLKRYTKIQNTVLNIFKLLK